MAAAPQTPIGLILMGIAGSGKTTVGRAFAAAVGLPFLDADDFHSETNRSKMAAGIPLTDGDRHPWLATLRETLAAELAQNQSVILACSALRQSYRQILAEAGPGVHFAYLDIPRDLAETRLQSRLGHFAGPDLLDSQWRTLEIPDPGTALLLDARQPVTALVEALQSWLNNLR